MEFFVPCWLSLLNIFPTSPSQADIDQTIPYIPELLQKCEVSAQEAKPRAMTAIARLKWKSKNAFDMKASHSIDGTNTPTLFATCSEVNNPSCDTDFAACWFILAQKPLFNDAPNLSYIKSIIQTLPERLDTCSKIVKEAHTQNVDALLAITIAFKESTFLSVKSNQNAEGPLGVKLKYHCSHKNKSLCDPIEVGVSAVQKYIDLNSNDLCTALAKYNAGECGRCGTPTEHEVPKSCRNSLGVPKWSLFEKSEAYASDVMEIYEELCMVFDTCHTC